MAARNHLYEFDSMVSEAFAPVCKWILYVCTGLFFLAFLAAPIEQILFSWFGCFPNRSLLGFQIWRFFTYALLHAGIWHLAVNMLGLYYFGNGLEYRKGSTWFLKLALVAVAFSALLHCLGSYLFSTIGANPFIVAIPMVGLSGFIFALMMMAALHDPDSPIMIFPFPVAIPLKYFVGILGVITLLSIPKSDGTAHLAHLGGLLVGWFFYNHPDVLDRIPTPSWGRKKRRGPEIHYGGRGAWRKL